MRSFAHASILGIALLGSSSARAFSYGDVPNVSTDKRAHEEIKEKAKPEEHEGGTYHPPPKPKTSWWDNGGHEQHSDVYTKHSHGADSGASSSHAGKAEGGAGKVEHLEGGATVTEVPVAKGHKASRASNE